MGGLTEISSTETYRQVETFVRSVWQPGFGQALDAGDLAAHPDSNRVAFTAQWWEKLDGRPGSRIGIVDLASGALRIATGGPSRDRLPAWSPDGCSLAFVSDRSEAGVDQLWLLEDEVGEATAAPRVEGTVESIAWSPDGSAILLVVAGRGAELAGIQGSGSTRGAREDRATWTPSVDTGDADHHWRRVWHYDVKSGRMEPVLREAGNFWEATWAGPGRVVGVVSDGPSEDDWYDSRLEVLDVTTGECVLRHTAERQLGVPASAPDGRLVSVITGLASDRAVVSGDLLLLPVASGEPWRVETREVDVTHACWRDERSVVLSGHRGHRTVVAEVDVESRRFTERWDSEGTCGGRVYPAAWPSGPRDIVLVHEAHDRPPAIELIRDNAASVVQSFAHGGSEMVRATIGSFEPVEWTAPDGRSIDGFLALPQGEGPFPLVVEIHGGPVWAFRNTWLGRARLLPLMLQRGFAHFWPNPRGSTGRGREFQELVYGDMGGDDALDILSGVDAVIDRFPIDPERLAVTGGSYGGYMTYLLTTLDDRFRAAAALCPISDYYSTHWTCNIPAFCSRFLGDDPENANGRYRTRSPIHDSSRCRTPTLTVVGARDRCAPPTQGEIFHRALLGHAHVESMLVTYPEEGHGVQTYPAAIDYLARVVSWFEDHLR